MLELSAQRTLGSHPYFVPVEHTRTARQTLGREALLAPEVACVLDADAESARARAREYARLYLRLRNYTRNLLNVGFDDNDIADGGSDRLIDAVVVHGNAESVASAAREHVSAGADHVCLQTVGVNGVPRSEWSALATALGLAG
jgi:probable F420-dependent oxidoreductase